ncbi:MAG: YtxH domain-containing protein [Ignavibacteria bacterium]|nr:YtxH domain-containing protein [Ignavibacteria bacterium]
MIEKVINKKGYLSGLITGGVIGGLAALLFTPKSGKELRKNIGEKLMSYLTVQIKCMKM